jgi:hypothetical protein
MDSMAGVASLCLESASVRSTLPRVHPWCQNGIGHARKRSNCSWAGRLVEWSTVCVLDVHAALLDVHGGMPREGSRFAAAATTSSTTHATSIRVLTRQIWGACYCPTAAVWMQIDRNRPCRQLCSIR